MPPKNKNKNKRKNQGKRKNSQQGSSNASSPSANASSPPVADTPTTATSSTVEQELITPGALDLKIANALAPVPEGSSTTTSSMPTPAPSDVMDDDGPSPDPRTDDVEYQEDDGMKTPTQEMPQSSFNGAAAAAAAATAAAAGTGATQNATEAPSASYAQKTAETPAAPQSPPKTQSPPSQGPKNPFRDNASGSTVEPAPATQSQSTTVEEATFDEVPLDQNQPSTKPATTTARTAAAAAMSGSSVEPHRAMSSDEVPTLKGLAPTTSVGTPVNASMAGQETLASPPPQHEAGNPFLTPGAPIEQESLEQYRSRTHMGYEKPRPSEPFMQMDAAPDSAPTDNFVSNGGANQGATEEPQNVWAPGQQGFERSEHTPSTSSAATNPAAAVQSNNFVVNDSTSESVVEDEQHFTREGQTGLWHPPVTSPASQQPSARQLTPNEMALENNAPPPKSYPFPAHTSAAAHDDNQSPKSLMPSDPQLPLPEIFEPTANNIAPLGPSSTENVRESIELPELPEESVDGFLNPWTRSQQILAQKTGRLPSPGAEEAAISTPDLSKIKTPEFIRTTSATSRRSNEPLIPSTPLFAGKKYAHLSKISNNQLRGARPSVVRPRVPTQKSLKTSKFTEGTASGRSSRSKVLPPAVVESEFDDVRIDPPQQPYQSQPRDRFPSLITPAPVFMRARNEGRGQWARWSNLSWRTRAIAAAGFVVVVALVLGLAIGLVRRRDDKADESTYDPSNKKIARAMWVPKPGDTWEYQTRNRLKSKAALNERNLERNPTGAAVFDIDLFQNDKALIDELHANGTKVICYFSAGTAELWRQDANYFPQHAQGLGQAKKIGSRWLNINDGTVQQLMRKRVDLAVNKDCDAIDPAFIDAYQWPVEGTGFSITEDDAVAYVKMLAEHAHNKNLAFGLRRASEIAARLMEDVDFSVCESCSKTKDCEAYQMFIDAGKPVFHVEYANETTSVLEETSKEELESMCNVDGSEGFSTIVKRHNQDEWIVDCERQGRSEG